MNTKQIQLTELDCKLSFGESSVKYLGNDVNFATSVYDKSSFCSLIITATGKTTHNVSMNYFTVHADF
jgi:hypothetical protein